MKMAHGISDFIDTGKYSQAEPAEALDTEDEAALPDNSYNNSYNKTLHVSDSSSVHHQEFSLCTQQCYMSYRFADSLRAGSGRIRPDPDIYIYTHTIYIYIIYIYILIIKPTRCTNFSNLFLV